MFIKELYKLIAILKLSPEVQLADGNGYVSNMIREIKQEHDKSSDIEQ